jgi:type I restriction enzyme R subunit
LITTTSWGCIARFSAQAPGKQKMNRDQLIGLIQSDAKFMDERDDIAAYINTLKAGEGLSEKDIREGYQRFKAEKNAQELATIARETRAGHRRRCKVLWTASCNA